MNRVIVVTGTPFEQGVTQGEALREVIAQNVANTKRKLAADRVDMAYYEKYIARNARFLEQNHPEQIEEIRGIAQGADLPFEDLLSLNIPAYFMTEYLNQECSMLLARGGATADGNTYLIKNRDMSTEIHQAVIQREGPGLSVIEVNGAGTVTYPASGVNSRGLALATTGFWSKAAAPDIEQIDAAHIFVNIRILLEQCATVDDVIERLRSYPRMNGLNILAADYEQAAVIETTRDGFEVERDDGSGVLFRSNHYLIPALTHLNPAPGEYSSTHRRLARIDEMVRERLCRGKLRFQDFWRIMSDHQNGDDCICRHPHEGFPAHTISSSMVVLEDMEAWTAIDNPCQSLYYAKLGARPGAASGEGAGA